VWLKRQEARPFAHCEKDCQAGPIFIRRSPALPLLRQPVVAKKKGKQMKAKQKTTKSKKSQVRVRDIKPSRSPAGGRKHKHGGGDRPVEYLKVKMSDVIITS
jgi:hypothetical protein